MVISSALSRLIEAIYSQFPVLLHWHWDKLSWRLGVKLQKNTKTTKREMCVYFMWIKALVQQISHYYQNFYMTKFIVAIYSYNSFLVSSLTCLLHEFSQVRNDRRIHKLQIPFKRSTGPQQWLSICIRRPNNRGLDFSIWQWISNFIPHCTGMWLHTHVGIKLS